jgi:hypothetical protein
MGELCEYSSSWITVKQIHFLRDFASGNERAPFTHPDCASLVDPLFAAQKEG